MNWTVEVLHGKLEFTGVAVTGMFAFEQEELLYHFVVAAHCRDLLLVCFDMAEVEGFEQQLGPVLTQVA